MRSEELEEKLSFYKMFLLNSNEKLHTNKKGVMAIESLAMNNFIVDWFNDFEKDILKIVNKKWEAKIEKFIDAIVDKRFVMYDRKEIEKVWNKICEEKKE